MTRSAYLLSVAALFVLFVFVGPPAALAQRHGGHGAGTGTQRPTGVSDKDDLKDFKRAMALQATPEQVQQFRRLADSVQAARKQAQDVLLIANAGANAGPTDSFVHDLNQHADPLSDAVDETQKEKEKFLKSLNPAQKSALKTATKKLEKTGSEIAKQSKTLAQLLDHSVPPSKAEARRIVSPAEKLEKALGDLQSGQHSVGNEMGIQDEPAPAQNKPSGQDPTKTAARLVN